MSGFVLKYWSQVLFVISMTFFAGSWFERSGSQADMAVVKSDMVELKQVVKDLAQIEQSHDRNISRLIDNQAAMQKQLETANRKDKH
jgi:hypothetical protein